MSDKKKPAHEVVIEMIIETIETYDKCDGGTQTLKFMTILSTEISILKRMIIPEKHRKEVFKSLQQIRERLSLLGCAEALLPDSVFLAIDPTIKKTEE